MRWSIITSGFQSTLPARGATFTVGLDILIKIFQSTLPARGATTCSTPRSGSVIISIHAPRTGSDGIDRGLISGIIHFNPRSPHGERHHCCRLKQVQKSISIHAPRTGSDNIRRSAFDEHYISIHAPRTGSDGKKPAGRACMIFQSTLPARGATFARLTILYTR